MEEIEIRKNELQSELKKYNLEIRGDSRLSYCYINNTLGSEWDIKKVVFEICLTNWLFNYTNYPIICDSMFKHYSKLFVNKSVGYNYVKTYVQPYIKSHTIYSMGGIPQKWPWIK